MSFPITDLPNKRLFYALPPDIILIIIGYYSDSINVMFNIPTITKDKIELPYFNLGLLNSKSFKAYEFASLNSIWKYKMSERDLYEILHDDFQDVLVRIDDKEFSFKMKMMSFKIANENSIFNLMNLEDLPLFFGFYEKVFYTNGVLLIPKNAKISLTRQEAEKITLKYLFPSFVSFDDIELSSFKKNERLNINDENLTIVSKKVNFSRNKKYGVNLRMIDYIPKVIIDSCSKEKRSFYYNLEALQCLRKYL
jgi:hypothetical protein